MSTHQPPATGSSGNEAVLSTLREEEARFKVWAGNIGAHKTGRSSLDYRLREASHIQKQALELLTDLIGLVEDARAILAREKTPWDELDDDDHGSLLEEMVLETNSKDDEFPETELDQIAIDVGDVINCLLRLSVAIRNPAPHDRFVASVTDIDTEHYEPFDIRHVQGKFGNVDESLAKRLGKAISRRRQYFKYRERHHQKLSQGITADPADLPPTKASKDSVSTIASSIPEEIQRPSFDTIQLTTVDEDAVSDSGVSQTSFASSIAEAEKLKIPPLPKGAGKGPFECPFCYMMITATSTISWRRHVFGDLRPYICLSEECPETGREFARRHEWTGHELQNHWKKYVCPSGCEKTFANISQCREHLITSHPGSIPTSQIGAMISLSARPMGPDDGIMCPLCQEPLISFKQYQRHVGRHQEQLALFALPPLQSMDGEDDEGDNISQSDDGGARSEGADVSYHKVEKDINGSEPGDTSMAVDDKASSGRASDDEITGSESDTYTIKCICGFIGDGGNTIYCEICETWQHIECYYPNNVEDTVCEDFDHACVECEPRSLNRQVAYELQKSRLCIPTSGSPFYGIEPRNRDKGGDKGRDSLADLDFLTQPVRPAHMLEGRDLNAELDKLNQRMEEIKTQEKKRTGIYNEEEQMEAGEASSSTSGYRCHFDGCKNAVFTRRCDFRKHQKNHLKEHHCGICPPELWAGSAERKDLHRHMWSHHRDTARAQNVRRDGKVCPYCGRRGRRDNLKRHVKICGKNGKRGE